MDVCFQNVLSDKYFFFSEIFKGHIGYIIAELLQGKPHFLGVLVFLIKKSKSIVARE